MRGKHRILVVDDDEVIREALKDVLEEEGYLVETAVDGRDAIARLRSSDAKPSMILLDLMMPVMNGWEFLDARRLSPELSPIPVTVFTASRGAEAALANLDVDGSLVKPLGIYDLLAAVERRCPRTSPDAVSTVDGGAAG
jgi:two-component system, chemotaxis family, chemotaxis protein CheY